jgi:hypothetical protein
LFSPRMWLNCFAGQGYGRPSPLQRPASDSPFFQMAGVAIRGHSANAPRFVSGRDEIPKLS